MIPHVKNYTIAKDMWDMLAKMFIDITLARKMQLKTQLQHIKMELGMTILDYVRKIRKIVDELKIVDYVIDDDEFIRVCLEGFPRNYDVFKTSISMLGIQSFDELRYVRTDR